ncbi:unnamed protein product [Candidula unifasciata]|uniref:Uncharacterized protein n=1 Tax=Candidula unifasciata TaxID=100452 RepID=A0A8S3ZIN5_9EUPU|nr:unnamed protein product [Candidula unifasciata]
MQPFVAMLFFYSVVAALLAVGSSLPTFGHTCPTTQVPPTNVRGVNRLNRSSNTPLYRLEIVSHFKQNHSTSESLTYNVQIFAKNDAFFFSDAKISLASKSPCEAGSLTFDPHDFFDAKQSEPTCPRLLLTNRKLPMGDLPSLSWKPPACGCVQFRAVVISVHNVYYADNEDVQNGPLTQTVCVHQKATRELYFNTLCQVTEKHSAAEILSQPSFLHRHQLEARWMDKHGLEMGLELRRSDNKLCCSKVSLESKLACFDDSRRRRVDRFCEDGYPDVPFTSFRVTHMRDREKRCCFLLGELRYRCFAENSELARGPAVTMLDFSQDETDPVNDLAEFAFPHDADVIKIIGTVTFGENRGITHEEGNNDNEDNDEKEEDDDDTADQNKAVKSSKKVPAVTDENEHLVEVIREFSPSSAKASPQMHLQSPVEGTRSHPKIASDHSPKLTSAERRKTRRNNGEPENWVSAERVGSRRASSREYTADGRRVSGAEGRRASNERAGRKRTSEEQYKPATGSNSWGVPGYEDTYSRGTGLSRERQALSSAERRSRAKGSAQRRHDWAEVSEPDFEDQGGKSVAVTLDKLQKKMDRLLMRRQCCEAGAVAGRPVYGWFSPVRRECEHSGQKHIQAMDVTSGLRSCLDQFVKCCIELAVSGPVVTSSEFRENQFLFANNQKKLGPVGGLSGLDRRGDEWGQTPARRHPEEIARDVPGRESLEAYELESEKRFSSMRKIEAAPKDDIEDEEKDGPKRFDEVDNDDEDKYFDIFDRKDETVNKTAGKAEGDAEVVHAVDAKSAVTENIDKSGETTKLSAQSDDKKQKQDGESNEDANKEKHKNPVAKDSSNEKQDGGSSNQSARLSSKNTDNKQNQDDESNEEEKKVGHKDTAPKENKVSDLVDRTEKEDGDSGSQSTELKNTVGHKQKQIDESNEEANKGQNKHAVTKGNNDRESGLVESTEKQDGDSGSQSTELKNTVGHKQKQIDESNEEANKGQNKHAITKGNNDRESGLVESTEKQDGDSGSQSTKLRKINGKKHKQDDKSDEEANRGNLRDKATKDNLDRVSDPADSMGKLDGYSSRQHEASLLAKTSGGRSRQTRNNRAGGQSKAGRTSSREVRHSTSRGTSRERQQYSHTFYTNRGSYRLAPSGKIGTEDSREMAAAHVRKFMGALDSKEMVDAYRKTNLESTDVINDGPSQRSTRRKKYKRQRWYYRR